ncbi:hypothetical protein RFI_16689 [Reticulomyxa filosa]|uniref:Uncharacterized protein n=1 Tax=Reticulomyxa filosa TaxID=46433 RepID=X6N453_RETFI|nr:hypothetical protein RFI_16689 [Reticulomyxa filosa]|eukprot:ETO20529.1 hypothetical protein RFI_16689 [Reticulomyxa filosa]
MVVIKKKGWHLEYVIDLEFGYLSGFALNHYKKINGQEENDFDDEEDEEGGPAIAKKLDTFWQYIHDHSSRPWVSGLCFTWIIGCLWCLENDLPLLAWTVVGTYWWSDAWFHCQSQIHLMTVVMFAVLLLSYLLFFTSIFLWLIDHICRRIQSTPSWSDLLKGIPNAFIVVPIKKKKKKGQRGLTEDKQTKKKSHEHKNDTSVVEITADKESWNKTPGSPTDNDHVVDFSFRKYSGDGTNGGNTLTLPNVSHVQYHHHHLHSSHSHYHQHPSHDTHARDDKPHEDEASKPVHTSPYTVSANANANANANTNARASTLSSSSHSVSNGYKRYIINATMEDTMAMQKYLLQHKQHLKIDVHQAITQQRLKCKLFEQRYVVVHANPLPKGLLFNLFFFILLIFTCVYTYLYAHIRIEVTVNEARTDVNIGKSPSAQDTALLFEGDDFFCDPLNKNFNDKAEEDTTQADETKKNTDRKEEETPETENDWKCPRCTEIGQELMDCLLGCSNLPTLTLLVRKFDDCLTYTKSTTALKSTETSLLVNLSNKKHNDSKLDNPTYNVANTNNKKHKPPNPNPKKKIRLCAFFEPPLTKQAMNSISNAFILNREPDKNAASVFVNKRNRVSTEDIRGFFFVCLFASLLYRHTSLFLFYLEI